MGTRKGFNSEMLSLKQICTIDSCNKFHPRPILKTAGDESRNET